MDGSFPMRRYTKSLRFNPILGMLSAIVNAAKSAQNYQNLPKDN